jgi:hypothetical protein
MKLEWGTGPELLERPIVSGAVALMYVRLAYPGSTDKERQQRLLDALEHGEVQGWIPPNTVLVRDPSPTGEPGLILFTPLFFEKAIFSEPSLKRCFSSEKAPSKAKAGRPPIPLDLLIPEMCRLAFAGKLPSKQIQAARLLEAWLKEKHPDRYATEDGIRGNNGFLAEHRRLTGSKP